MKKGVILFFIIGFISLSLVAAEVQTLPPVQTGQCTTLKQTCGNCTFVNFTITVPPNQSVFLVNQTMQRQSSTLFTAPFCNTTINGDYIYDTYSDPDGIVTPSPVSFTVNPLGKVLTNSQAILYFLVFIISFFLFIGAFTFAIFAPSKYKKDQMTGYIIAVENLKYLKYLSFALSYLLLMLMFYFGWAISYGYLDMSFLGDLFNFGFYVLVAALVPLFIVCIFVIIANLVRDAQIVKMINRGLNVRE